MSGAVIRSPERPYPACQRVLPSLTAVSYTHLFLCVVGYLHPAPLAPQHSFAIDDKGTTLDTANLFAVHRLHLDHREAGTERLFAVGKQIEGQLLFDLEVFVRFEAVTRDADDDGSRTDELRMQITELLRLGGASRRAVLGVEIKDDSAALAGGQSEGPAAGCRQAEIGYGVVDHGWLSGIGKRIADCGLWIVVRKAISGQAA